MFTFVNIHINTIHIFTHRSFTSTFTVLLYLGGVLEKKKKTHHIIYHHNIAYHIISYHSVDKITTISLVNW